MIRKMRVSAINSCFRDNNEMVNNIVQISIAVNCINFYLDFLHYNAP